MANIFNASEYLNRIDDMVKALRGRGDIEVSTFVKRAPGQIEAAKKYLTEKYNRVGLTSDMITFFKSANGFRLEWKYIGSDK